MKKKNLKSLLYKSNTFNYGQLLLNNIVILTVKSEFLSFKKSDLTVRILKKLYNDKRISYTTLSFFFKKTKKLITYKADVSFLKLLTELAWESGLLLEKKIKCKCITFYGK
jgi:hypothetical protein